MVRSWAAGSGAIGATDPLAAVGTLLPSGVTPASGGGPSHGAEHPDVVAQRPQHPGQAEHLPLDAARDGQAVGQTSPMRTGTTLTDAHGDGCDEAAYHTHV